MNTLRAATVFGLFLGCVRADSQCCGEIGCFSDDYPFDHLPTPDCLDTLSVRLELFTRSNPTEGKLITGEAPNFQLPSEYSSWRGTTFLIHGWFGDDETAWLDEIGTNLLSRFDMNVVHVSWSGGSQNLWYPKSASGTRVVGAHIAELARQMVDQEWASRSDIWCVGHSLGAHTCGHMGNRYKIGRITGMDPAGPLYENYPVAARLNTGSADFVDIIHTNSKPGVAVALGILPPIGHVDFYPNAGARQPGCILDPFVGDMADPNFFGDFTPACSHGRAIQYFAESIISQSCKFTSNAKCTDIDYMPGSCGPCSGGTCQVLGPEAIDWSERGVFYLNTGSSEPFCTGRS